MRDAGAGRPLWGNFLSWLSFVMAHCTFLCFSVLPLRAPAHDFCSLSLSLCALPLSRYRVIPSPLPALKWWRVVVDEAHMVESTTQETAKMALKIPAVHR